MDVAVVDLLLPDGPPAEAIWVTRGAGPSVAVLAMTAIEDEKVHERFLEAGAVEVLPRSCIFPYALAAVRRLGARKGRQGGRRVTRAVRGVLLTTPDQRNRGKIAHPRDAGNPYGG